LQIFGAAFSGFGERGFEGYFGDTRHSVELPLGSVFDSAFAVGLQLSTGIVAAEVSSFIGWFVLV
jgi:hypothetical protein